MHAQPTSTLSHVKYGGYWKNAGSWYSPAAVVPSIASCTPTCTPTRQSLSHSEPAAARHQTNTRLRQQQRQPLITPPRQTAAGGLGSACWPLLIHGPHLAIASPPFRAAPHCSHWHHGIHCFQPKDCRPARRGHWLARGCGGRCGVWACGRWPPCAAGRHRCPRPRRRTCVRREQCQGMDYGGGSGLHSAGRSCVADGIARRYAPPARCRWTLLPSAPAAWSALLVLRLLVSAFRLVSAAPQDDVPHGASSRILLPTRTRTTAAEGREWPLSKYRNIGIMAHIDAGKVSGRCGRRHMLSVRRQQLHSAAQPAQPLHMPSATACS